MGPVLWIVLLGAALRLGLAAFVTEWVLVDDAYITLRYAVNGSQAGGGGLVYNHGEAVFGVTSPLWGFLTTGMVAAVGRAWIEIAVVSLGVLLWALAGIRVGSVVRGSIHTRALIVGVFTFAPVFVDNAMLGMETPLFVFLLVFASSAAMRGEIRASSVFAGLLMIARPEGVLFAPALVALGVQRLGSREFARQLKGSLVFLTLPAVLWTAFALVRYGTVLPASMVAKSGWNNAHYSSLQSIENAWFGFARLTFVPFVDYFPNGVAHAVTAVLAISVAVIGRAAAASRQPLACAMFLSYLLYVAFYLLGKGATEASWYSVPSSVALLLATGPALERAGTWLAYSSTEVGRASRRQVAATCAALVGCMGLSTALVGARAPLLHSYVDGYGRCADALEDICASRPSDGDAQRVLIGEIGVFGFRSKRHVIDVGALVSPQVLPLKNRGLSLVAIAIETEADWLVVSDIALERNHYPSVGVVHANDVERRWLAQAECVAHFRDKSLLKLPRTRQIHTGKRVD